MTQDLVAFRYFCSYLPGVFVSVVFDGTDGAIGFMQAVDTLDDITIAGLVLVFVVAGMRVLDFVLELVFGVILKNMIEIG